MTTPAPFVLDSDVFIAAKNAYYAFDICPGFWNGILRAFRRGSVRSIDRIRNELLSGRKEEDLARWFTNEVPTTFFHDSNAEDVSAAFAEVTSRHLEAAVQTLIGAHLVESRRWRGSPRPNWDAIETRRRRCFVHACCAQVTCADSAAALAPSFTLSMFARASTIARCGAARGPRSTQARCRMQGGYRG